ncbi:23S rRNA accumulation protein YceD [Orbaceae bacterium ESL0727]|nr:23S rRNA accumulation protein YceD [Orbaceae bacterium ESL0727]
MQNRLPLTLDPIKTAQRKLDYVGYYPAQSATRVERLKSDIECSLSFYFDEQKLCVISVDAEVTLEQICQRCFKPFITHIKVKNKFSPVKNDAQAEALPDYYEPVFINELGEVDILALVEDEIILSLPIAPVHDSKHCEVSEADLVFGEIPVENEKPNPFAILASLKNKE